MPTAAGVPDGSPEPAARLGLLFRGLRERALLTQEDLARRTGLSARTIRRLESGQLRRPRADSVRLLVMALDITGPERETIAALVRDEPVGEPPDPPAQPAATVPRQLPAVPLVVGRLEQLRRLDTLDRRRPPTMVIVAISGTAGVGKTTLAVYWAHRVAAGFPDGQLYVNLRGFDPSRAPLAPADALRGFLSALGTATKLIPDELDEQAALYRSLVAGRRVLVVLDNARDAEQVRPLLPGSTGCLVVVTSRKQLPGLVAAEGAHPLTLEPLTAPEAGELLVRRLGDDRAATEPAVVQRIVDRCAGLPLAIAIVAARWATRTDVPLARLAAELTAVDHGLAAFTVDDPATDVRAVFSWSYRALSPDAARLFRLVGLHPGPDVGVPGAAALLGGQVDQVRPLLTELVGAHLLTEHRPGRYTLHDLLRAYAIELAQDGETAPQRQAALHRISDHYLHTAHAAALQLHPHREQLQLTGPRPDVAPASVDSEAEAMRWFTAEHPVLLAVLDEAAAAGFDTHAWQLAWSIWEFFDRRGLWQDWIASQRVGLAAAQRLGERRGVVYARRSLGLAYLYLGRHDDAEAQFTAALAGYRELDDAVGQARMHHNLCGVREQQDRLAEALDHAERARELFEASGHRQGLANALNAVGWFQVQVGRAEDAVRSCGQALALLEQLGDRRGAANTWDSLGYAHHHLGRYDEAVRCYEVALRAYRDADDRYMEADTLQHLAATLSAAGAAEAAGTALRQALAILDDLGHASAQEVRVRLEAASAGR